MYQNTFPTLFENHVKSPHFWGSKSVSRFAINSKNEYVIRQDFFHNFSNTVLLMGKGRNQIIEKSINFTYAPEQTTIHYDEWEEDYHFTSPFSYLVIVSVSTVLGLAKRDKRALGRASSFYHRQNAVNPSILKRQLDFLRQQEQQQQILGTESRPSRDEREKRVEIAKFVTT